jgi:hypothetical protein
MRRRARRRSVSRSWFAIIVAAFVALVASGLPELVVELVTGEAVACAVDCDGSDGQKHCPPNCCHGSCAKVAPCAGARCNGARDGSSRARGRAVRAPRRCVPLPRYQQRGLSPSASLNPPEETVRVPQACWRRCMRRGGVISRVYRYFLSMVHRRARPVVHARVAPRSCSGCAPATRSRRDR